MQGSQQGWSGFTTTRDFKNYIEKEILTDEGRAAFVQKRWLPEIGRAHV
jgi:hypothetical protein